MSRLVVVNGRTYRNLVEGTFENGVGTWVQGSAQSPVSVTTAQKRRGEQSLSAQRTGSTGPISFWSNDTSTAPSTRPGERYVFRAWLRTSTLMRGVRLRVQWLTSAGQQVSITDPNTWGGQRPLPPDEWVLFELEATAPAGAAKFRFGVLTNNEVTAGSVMYCDDAVAYRVPNLFVPTATQVLNLENVRQRTDSFRFELCDKDLKPIGELHPDFSQTPTIQNDTSNSSSRRLQNLKLFPDEEQDVNPLTDRVRVYMTLQDGTEYRLGTFMWADNSRPLREWGEEHHSELVDLSFILDQQSTRAFSWGRNANPIGLIFFFLLFKAGFKLEDVKVIGQEANRALTEPVAWEPGVTWSQMLKDLCAVVGFADPWFDRDGKLHLDTAPDPALDDITVPSYDTFPRIYKDTIVHSDDLLKAPNDFAVFESGTDRIQVGRQVLPASAPHSYQNRGFYVGLVESTQGLANQAAANKAAAALARTKGVAYEWLSFESTLDPRHETYDVVEVQGKKWLETSWSMELRSGGKMTHTLRRTAYG